MLRVVAIVAVVAVCVGVGAYLWVVAVLNQEAHPDENERSAVANGAGSSSIILWLPRSDTDGTYRITLDEADAERLMLADPGLVSRRGDPHDMVEIRTPWLGGLDEPWCFNGDVVVERTRAGSLPQIAVPAGTCVSGVGPEIVVEGFDG